MSMRQDPDLARDLPPLPDHGSERRDQQVKIRLTGSEVEALMALRPDLKPSGIVSLLVDDVVKGRHRPGWAAPSGSS